ncbi:ROK family protein [Rathayibacter sp. VKM Ac-2803]|uniref:ROK family protein n=1 Tax=unclassified Rathayibacter TaxID=2609250 RepID=UPI0013591B8F|nr:MULTISPECIES: ROK family protein [unclassified Rathayibacter]MWV48536.1 ROK family protein [Rathayibacter sp. VKM Ac-2803]MWV60126.1 ROK family protein [Rathayibacter sp. VKM Ac-2754]
MQRVDQRRIRTVNASLTLRALYDGGTLTIDEVRRATGLSRRTTEAILEDLGRREWVVDVEPERRDGRGRGRPARRYAFNSASGAIVAVRLDLEDITVTVADLSGAPIVEHAVATPRGLRRPERIGVLRTAIEAALAASGRSAEAVLAVTVSTLGIVRDDGLVDLPMTIPEWSRFSIAREIDAMFDCPVRVENDAKLAALGERMAGVARGVDDFVRLRADRGTVGLGIVLRGELFRGHDGVAGEIVWAERYGLAALDRHVLGGLGGDDAERSAGAAAFVAAVRSGDPSARASAERLAEELAPGLAILAWTLAPELIVLDGAFAELQEVFVPAFERELARAGTAPASRFAASELGSPSAILHGALRSCLDEVQALLFSGSELDAAPSL